MRDTQPSATALMSAAARAAHLIVDDEPYLFRDSLAGAMLGERAEELIAYHRVRGDHIVLAGTRAQVTTRSYYAEKCLATGGFEQYVILGAGLDTFAYRSALVAGLTVFEVDHPATQSAKRRMLSERGVEPLGRTVYLPLDLETDSLVPHLVSSGFDPARPSLIACLGVLMYLSSGAVEGLVASLGVLSGAGTPVASTPTFHLILEYALPPSHRDFRGAAYADIALTAAADHGEPWLSFHTPSDMDDLLARHGFSDTTHIPQSDCVPVEFWSRTDVLVPADLCRLAHTHRVVPPAAAAAR
ncbi:class I SAM-dependent methyltransferase [Nocardia sp. NPDC004068]|uniref:class I SAM-dependent methyltransferase n=1 Tax=Nocardia sp. NPDC004068 TaxID=3364303 RepID=UPI0036A57A5A